MFPYPDDHQHYTMDKPFSSHPLNLTSDHHLSSFNSSTFCPFSPLTIHPDTLHALLTQLESPPAPPGSSTPTKETAANAPLPKGRKRASRKDRHSKIFTAQGPRDRRMRLSLDVARKFFDLQDLLGFDKASKTVQWLLTMSKAAISELATTSKPKAENPSSCGGGGSSKTIEGSNSECEDISTVTANPCSNSTTKKIGATLPKDSRDKARARARERTKEKQRKHESVSHDLKSPLELVAEAEEQCSPSLASELLLPGSGPITVFDYHQSAMFQEQWDMNLLAEIQFQNRLWEG